MRLEFAKAGGMKVEPDRARLTDMRLGRVLDRLAGQLPGDIQRIITGGIRTKAGSVFELLQKTLVETLQDENIIPREASLTEAAKTAFYDGRNVSVDPRSGQVDGVAGIALGSYAPIPCGVPGAPPRYRFNSAMDPAWRNEMIPVLRNMLAQPEEFHL